MKFLIDAQLESYRTHISQPELMDLKGEEPEKLGIETEVANHLGQVETDGLSENCCLMA